jgi:hypothetical protein
MTNRMDSVFPYLCSNISLAVADPEISKGGGATPEIEKKSHIFGLKS